MNKTILSSALLFAFSSTALAQHIDVVGTLPTVIHTNHSGQGLHHRHKEKVVLLQHIKLSKAAKQYLAHPPSMPAEQATVSQPALPSQYQVGMDNVPVLDQGAHGSCVTFATTGAIDALLNQGDYISQLCSLSLGKYLEEKDNNYPSGWDGSWGPLVLKQMMHYGMVSKAKQKDYGCAGVSVYPLNDPSQTGNPMSIRDYQVLGETLKETVTWKSLLHWQDAFSERFRPNKLLNLVKQNLRLNKRLTFGVLLDVDQGHTGALGSFKAPFDTWMLTPAIKDDAAAGIIEAGHEMVITGYDDDAVVTSADGTVNTGVLTLRNSWSTLAGDNGNYYMTYAHFKLMTMEVQLIDKRKA